MPLDEHPTAGQYHCDYTGNLSDCLADDGRHLKAELAYQAPLEGLTIEVRIVRAYESSSSRSQPCKFEWGAISLCRAMRSASCALMRSAMDRHCVARVSVVSGCWFVGVDRLPPYPRVLQVVSVQPKAFRVVDFLSEFETDYIIQQASPKLGKSTVGHGEDARDSGTRTSKSAWLHRGHSVRPTAAYPRSTRRLLKGSKFNCC